MSARNEKEDDIYSIVSEQIGTPVDELNREDHLIDYLGLDSLDMVDLHLQLEDEFGIQVDDAEMAEIISKGGELQHIYDVLQPKIDAAY